MESGKRKAEGFVIWGIVLVVIVTIAVLWVLLMMSNPSGSDIVAEEANNLAGGILDAA